MKNPAPIGAGFETVKKSRRVFFAAAKNKFNRFLRRRVRRRKHFSRSEVSNCTPLAYNRGMERSAIPFVEEDKVFFDKPKSGPDRGRIFQRL